MCAFVLCMNSVGSRAWLLCRRGLWLKKMDPSGVMTRCSSLIISIIQFWYSFSGMLSWYSL